MEVKLAWRLKGLPPGVKERMDSSRLPSGKCGWFLHFSLWPTFVIQMIGNFLVIVIQHSNADSQCDFWSKLEWLWWALHAVYPPLKLKTKQHAKTHHTQRRQDDWQRHTVTEDVSFPGRVVGFYSSSYFTRLVITLFVMTDIQSDFAHA